MWTRPTLKTTLWRRNYYYYHWILLRITQQVGRAGNGAQAIQPQGWNPHSQGHGASKCHRSISAFVIKGRCWPFFRVVVGLNKAGFVNRWILGSLTIKGILLGESIGVGEIRLATESHTPLTTASQPTVYTNNAFYLFSFFHLATFCFLHYSQVTIQIDETDSISFPCVLHSWLPWSFLVNKWLGFSETVWVDMFRFNCNMFFQRWMIRNHCRKVKNALRVQKRVRFCLLL